MPTLDPRKVKFIVVHCSATPPKMDIGAKEIDAWHRKPPFNFDMIGYHRVIRRNGMVEHGRLLSQAGAHTQGWNTRSVGVCMVGGADEKKRPADNFTSAQYAALAQELLRLLSIFPEADILGHRDLSPDKDGDGIVERHEWVKECPSFDVRGWWAEHSSV